MWLSRPRFDTWGGFYNYIFLSWPDQQNLHIAPLLYIELQMTLNGCFHLTLLDADIPLGHSSGTMLEQLLHQRDVVMAVLVDLRGIILSETMGADPGISQIVTNQLQVPLD